MCSCCQSLAAKKYVSIVIRRLTHDEMVPYGIHKKTDSSYSSIYLETCSSPEKAAELGADTVLLPLEESGRVGGEPGGACTRCPPPPFTGVPSQSRFRRMDGLQQEKRVIVCCCTSDQCCGSGTFWYGSGSGDPYLGLTDPDPTPGSRMPKNIWIPWIRISNTGTYIKTSRTKFFLIG
jgi:hypothetical protein